MFNSINNLVTEKTCLLGGLIYIQSVRDKYLQINPNPIERIIDNQRSVYHSIEGTIHYCIASDPFIRPNLLMKFLLDQYGKLPPADKEFRDSYAKLMLELDKQSMYTERVCLTILDATAQARVVNQLRDRVIQTSSMVHMQEAIAAFSTKLHTIQKNPNDTTRIWHPLDDLNDLLTEVNRVPTGIGIVDTVLEGGIALGSHVGILGPSGGGKTILANMAQCNFAIRKLNTLFIQFEQEIGGDIASRMYSYMTGLPKDVFFGKAASNLPPHVIEKIKEYRDVWNRMRCISFADKVAVGKKGSNEVVDNIKMVMDTGFIPDVIIIDWLGAAILGFMKMSRDDKAAYHMTGDELKGTINAFSRSHNMTNIYLHQTDNITQEREPAYKPNKNNAYNYHAFANDLEICLVIGKSTKLENGKQVAWIGSDKNRHGQTGKFVMGLIDGEYAKITECAEGEYALDAKGQFCSMKNLLTTKKSTMYAPADDSFDAYMSGNY